MATSRGGAQRARRPGAGKGGFRTLGLILPDSANPFFAEILRELEASAFAAGFSVVLCNSENDREKERRYVDVLVRNRVDGLLLVSAGDRGALSRARLPEGLPLVALDREGPRPGVDCVVADHAAGGRLATRHLIALGHRHIGCITGPRRVSSGVQRLGGYRLALEEVGLPVERGLVQVGDFHPESGWACARRMLAQRPPPTAIFACNDLMAMGVLRAAHELGRVVPRDLAVVGYDDIELCRYTIPPLSTVAQPKREMAREALRLMARRLREPRAAPVQRHLPVSLEVRETCGGVPARPAGAGPPK